MARPSLFNHPKFTRLVHILRMPSPHVLGHLEYLWRVGYATGNPVIGDVLDVEIAAEWTGEPGVFARALLEVRFLDQLEDGRLQIHDLFENAPSYVGRRAQRERSQAEVKVCDHCGGEFTTSDPRMKFCSAACRTGHWRRARAENRDGCDGCDGSETDCDVPVKRNVTQRDVHTGTARTGTYRHTPKILKSGSSAPAATGAKPVDDSPTVLEFPVVGKGGPLWRLTSRQLREWADLYPGLDIIAEAQKALAWLRANPGRRKTAQGMPRFLVSWLNRANDRGGRGMTTPTRSVPVPDMQATFEWRDECARLHANQCPNARYHDALIARERPA